MRLARGLAAALAGTAVVLSAASPALAGPGLLTVSPDYPAAVEIDSVKPQVALENGSVTITGKVRNTGRSVLKSAHAAVRAAVGSTAKALDTRSALAQVLTRGTPSTSTLDGADLPAPHDDLGDLSPGQSSDFTLGVSAGDLKLRATGAYELAVDVWDGSGSHPLGIARTFLPYNAGSTAKTQLSVLWPITHAPELVAQTMPDNDQTPVLRDDSLATDLAPGGRLYQLVDIGKDLPNLTWVVDPDLLDTVYAMTKPYRVQKPNTAGDSAKDDNTVAGSGQNAATEWLKRLRAAVAKSGSEVVSLPYADPDLASIAHNGADQNSLDTALRKAVTAGQVTTEGRLGVDVHSDVAWPYQGRLDQRIAATARSAGARLVLADGTSLPDPSSLQYTPDAARAIGDGQTAVVADTSLSEPFQGDLSTPEESSAAVQRFLADTMVITQEQPARQRSLLLMPPRSLTTGTAQALSTAVQKAQEGGWLSQVNLTAVAGATPVPSTDSVPADYPRDVAASELSSEALSETMAVESGLDQLLVILTQPQRVRGPFSAAMARSMSTEWRDQAKAADGYRNGVKGYLKNLTSAVKVPGKTVITLPGDNATLLVSVKNDLNQAVGNLQLRLTSGQLNRLRVVQQETVVLDATTSQTFRFPAQAQAPGSVQMTAQLWTTGPNPQPYGGPVTFTVDVTSVTNGVLYVIGGGVVLMVLAALRFSLQRKKQAAEGGDEDPSKDGAGADGTDGSDGSDGGAPARPEADAEPKSAADDADRVAGDEKVGH